MYNYARVALYDTRTRYELIIKFQYCHEEFDECKFRVAHRGALVQEF